uniref:Uncharacterized protein n=1 Tax=Megaselia scalaris TaxID=36166 RepID=T1GL42_MEGSC
MSLTISLESTVSLGGIVLKAYHNDFQHQVFLVLCSDSDVFSQIFKKKPPIPAKPDHLVQQQQAISGILKGGKLWKSEHSSSQLVKCSVHSNTYGNQSYEKNPESIHGMMFQYKVLEKYHEFEYSASISKSLNVPETIEEDL